MFQARDIVRDTPYCFRPVIHLRTGGVMALGVHACQAGGDLDHVRPVTGIDDLVVIDDRGRCQGLSSPE